MGIKGSGVIHPRYPSSIVENILMETDQFNIDNNYLEKIDIRVHISKPIKDHHWRPSERNINHYLIEREDNNNIHMDQGIIEIINKIRDGSIKILGMDGTTILDNLSHQSQT